MPYKRRVTRAEPSAKLGENREATGGELSGADDLGGRAERQETAPHQKESVCARVRAERRRTRVSRPNSDR